MANSCSAASDGSADGASLAGASLGLAGASLAGTTVLVALGALEAAGEQATNASADTITRPRTARVGSRVMAMARSPRGRVGADASSPARSGREAPRGPGSVSSPYRLPPPVAGQRGTDVTYATARDAVRGSTVDRRTTGTTAAIAETAP